MRRGQPGKVSTETGLAAAPFHFGPAVLVADDLDDPAALPGAVELHEEHALPGAEAEFAVADGYRLAGRPEEHRHAVGVTVAKLHVLGADVLGAPVPVVVRVVLLARHDSTQHAHEVLEEAGLEFVDANA